MFDVSSFLSAEDLQADCEGAAAKVFRHQKILQGTSFHILATAVSRSPSVLGTVEPDKAQRVLRLSGAANENPKVLNSLFFFVNFQMY